MHANVMNSLFYNPDIKKTAYKIAAGLSGKR